MTVPLAAAGMVADADPATALPRPAVASVTPTPVWSQTLGDTDNAVLTSSPNVADLDGSPAVVVGDQAGDVYAFHLADGSPVAGWPYDTGAPVDSTPSVAPVTGGSNLDTVFVGTGTAANPGVGGYQAISPGGHDQWFVQETNPPGSGAAHNGVVAGMALGVLQGGPDAVAGSLGQEELALNASNGTTLAGFPWFQGDSAFATPAIAPLYGTSTNDIVQSVSSSAGNSYGEQYQNGGALRILGPTGNAGQPEPNDGTVCQYETGQIIQSSPAVGEFFGNSATVGIVTGTGYFPPYGAAPTTNEVLALTTHCGLVWQTTLDGPTSASPALADVEGNGQLQVVEATQPSANAGTVWVLNGANGAPIWHTATPAAVIGSPVTADLTGQGYQDVLVPTLDGVYLYDGRTGAQVGEIGDNEGFQNSPLVTDDPDGTLGITVAGYNNVGQTVITHYEVSGPRGSVADEKGAWPMFHHDPQLSGDAGTPPPVVKVPCSKPKATPAGYYLAGGDGGIFRFGDLPFCGSTGAITLNQPVVGMARTPDGGGYWLVARDGGIFAFGDAGYYGSTGGRPIAAPIVDLVPTPDGKGYWEVGADGGIFSYGDAHYYGSTGALHLAQPIVAMATTADGKGYWLVAADGGIFAYGDAHFWGSTGASRLNSAIVGVAADTATGGYWLVAADGGIFAYHAPYFGSTGALHLNAPIVAMEATPADTGYRLVASDGGIFDFHAPYDGSEGGSYLAEPIVTMAGF